MRLDQGRVWCWLSITSLLVAFRGLQPHLGRHKSFAIIGGKPNSILGLRGTDSYIDSIILIRFLNLMSLYVGSSITSDLLIAIFSKPLRFHPKCWHFCGSHTTSPPKLRRWTKTESKRIDAPKCTHSCQTTHTRLSQHYTLSTAVKKKSPQPIARWFGEE